MKITKTQDRAICELRDRIQVIQNAYDGDLCPILDGRIAYKTALPKNLKDQVAKAMNALDTAFVNMLNVRDDVEMWEEENLCV